MSVTNKLPKNALTLHSITLPPNITSLGDGVFGGYFSGRSSSLQSINIPWSPTSNTSSKTGSLFMQALEVMTSCNMERWSRRRSEDGRLPLFTLLATSLKWIHIKGIFFANMLAIYETDALTGLKAFMLAAVGAHSDLESIYRLCRENPAALLF